MTSPAARLSAPARRSTDLDKPLLALAAGAVELEVRAEQLRRNATATRSAFAALRSQAVTLPS